MLSSQLSCWWCFCTFSIRLGNTNKVRALFYLWTICNVYILKWFRQNIKWLKLLSKSKVEISIWGFTHPSVLECGAKVLVLSVLGCFWKSQELQKPEIHKAVSLSVIICPAMEISKPPQLNSKQPLNVRGNAWELYEFKYTLDGFVICRMGEVIQENGRHQLIREELSK